MNAAPRRIAIDRDARLKDDPGTGHNRWHPDIAPIATVAPGEPIVLETRDASDGQIRAGMTTADLAGLARNASHPLTGPLHIAGAAPGDLLEVEFVDIAPQDYGWTRIRPGAGFLREHFPVAFLAHWHMADGYATSDEVPRVRIPQAAFMGTAGVAPSHAQLAAWTAREADLARRGGLVLQPDARDAVPHDDAIASTGLRTMPPRENGGNLDIRQLTSGARLFLPVAVDGARFSTGDAHYAQGDSECCVTAIEMGATVTLRFHLHPGRAARERVGFPRFAQTGRDCAAGRAFAGGFIATTGMPIEADGTQQGEDLTLAARNALLAMIDLLGERGYSREQAYVICSVAVDLRISNAVDLPNVTVSAFLPEDIFTH